MSRRLITILLLVVLALVVAGAVSDTSSLWSYPVIVTGATFLLALANSLPLLLSPRASVVPQEGAIVTDKADRRRQLLRVAGFCLVWTLYVLLLTRTGFVLASSLALVASIWIMLGRFRPLASLSAVIFVLALAVLLTTALFVPVPKGAVDHWIDETIYTLLED